MNDVIVLAAGLGRRLAGATTLPKWLAPVGDTSPSAVQLAGLVDAGASRVLVVTSDPATEIERAVEPWRERLQVALVPNPHAATRNNWYSLAVGLEAWLHTGQAEDVTIVNSDLYARPAWFVALLREMWADPEGAALAIDGVRPLTDEAMKVSLAGPGTIGSIGKVGINDPRGEYVGVSRWRRPAAEELLAILWGFEGQPERVDNWYEHGIQEHLLAGARYSMVPVPDSEWVEIDDERDLELARRIAIT